MLNPRSLIDEESKRHRESKEGDDDKQFSAVRTSENPPMSARICKSKFTAATTDRLCSSRNVNSSCPMSVFADVSGKDYQRR